VPGRLHAGSQPFRDRTGATIITFDPPGSISTVPVSISPAGVITGYYEEQSFVTHGFLRTTDGAITTFDAPGSPATIPASINAAGAITGYYALNGVARGFLRSPDGTITTFDAPGSIGTFPTSINGTGAITGYYPPPGGTFRGFLRTPDGTISPFDPPDAVQTVPWSINAAAEIAGQYADSSTAETVRHRVSVIVMSRNRPRSVDAGRVGAEEWIRARRIKSGNAAVPTPHEPMRK